MKVRLIPLALLITMGIVLLVLHALAPLMLFVIYTRTRETNELLRWLGTRSSASPEPATQVEEPVR